MSVIVIGTRNSSTDKAGVPHLQMYRTKYCKGTKNQPARYSNYGALDPTSYRKMKYSLRRKMNYRWRNNENTKQTGRNEKALPEVYRIGNKIKPH